MTASVPAHCAVLGSPITHSLSPAMHRAAYDALGLPWTYEALDTGVDDVAEVLSRSDQHDRPYWTGLSVTMPLKRAVLEHVDEVSHTARALGVANTVVFNGGRRTAHNTDVPGAVAALQQAGAEQVDTVRVIGGGATAASMAHAATRLGARHIEFRVRAPQRAEQSAAVVRGLGVDVSVTGLERPILDVVDLMMSTVPDNAIGSGAHEYADAASVVFDAIYDPWPTHLARAARQRERLLIGGLELLAHQAALQVRLMTGKTVDVGVLRDAAHDRLSGRVS